jgi:hypothetical protein
VRELPAERDPEPDDQDDLLVRAQRTRRDA